MAKRSKQSGRLWLRWEIDWSKRRRIGTTAYVWARNPASSQARARGWHWTTYAALDRVGIEWMPVAERKGRHLTTSGYVVIAKGTLTTKERQMVETAGLWIGQSRGQRRGVKEHHLVALKKYGALPKNFLIRHLNGDKTDNRARNLVLGTKRDNSLDHHAAVVQMMLWRERAMKAEQIDLIKALDEP